MKVFVSTVVFLCVLATTALAEDRHWYLSVKGGINAGPEGTEESQTIKTETGGAFLLAVGYDFDRFRLEGELSGRNNDLDLDLNGEVTNGALMINGVYEVPMTEQFTPLILGGIGLSQVTGKIPGVNEDETTFAYQVGFGVEYPMTTHLSFEVAYRFFGTPNITLQTVDVTNYNHTGLFGLTYAF